MASQPQPAATTTTLRGSDTGTNAPVRTLDQTQATGYNPQGYAVGIPLQDETGAVSNIRKNPDTGELYDATGFDRPAPPSIAPGRGAVEDSGTPTGNTTPSGSTTTSDSQTLTVTARPNILDQYPSYTWTASVYMLTPAQFRLFVDNPRRGTPNGYNLLFQSGGAPRGTGSAQGAQAGDAEAIFQNTDKRNPFFGEDFYIDNITLTTIPAGKGTGTAHSAVDLRFTVTEPANITLIDRLYKAAADLQKKSGDKGNYAAALYVMIIRFYATDLDGNIIQVKGNEPLTNGASVNTTLVEKYIPFQIRNINMTIESKLVNYEWDCTALGQNVGATVRRGTIPFDVELTGATVDQLLTGGVVRSNITTDEKNPGGSTVSQPQTGKPDSPIKVVEAPTLAMARDPAVVQGIIQAMNDNQANLVKNKLREFPDEYRIQYTSRATADIKTARVGKPVDSDNQVNTGTTGMAPAIAQNPKAAQGNTQRMDVTSRNVPITAGMQMIQVLELIIRNSSYVTDQQNIIYNETTNQVEINKNFEGPQRGFRWFNIISSATPTDNYDTVINDRQYIITYTIETYEVSSIHTPYAPPPRFQGVHKSYKYWFTGQNNAVLDYKEQHNHLYYQTLSGAVLETQKAFSSSMVEIPFYVPSARSNESGQFALGRANDISSNLAENIYNAADLANSEMRIIGDPAWIQQGSVLGVTGPDQFKLVPFNDDGSINFDTNQVLYEVAWQRPEDYDLSTGLADPYGRTGKSDPTRRPLQSRIYIATKVVSEFQGGVFQQRLFGSLYLWPIPAGTNRAPDTAQPADTSQQPTAAADTQSSEPQRQEDASNSLSRVTAPPFSLATSALDILNPPGQPLPAAGTVQNIFQSAFAQNSSNGSGPIALKIPTTLDFSALPTTTPWFSNLNITPADQLQTIVPPLPVTSNGVVVGTAAPATDQPQAKVAVTQVISRDA